MSIYLIVGRRPSSSEVNNGWYMWLLVQALAHPKWTTDGPSPSREKVLLQHGRRWSEWDVCESGDHAHDLVGIKPFKLLGSSPFLSRDQALWIKQSQNHWIESCLSLETRESKRTIDRSASPETWQQPTDTKCQQPTTRKELAARIRPRRGRNA